MMTSSSQTLSKSHINERMTSSAALPPKSNTLTSQSCDALAVVRAPIKISIRNENERQHADALPPLVTLTLRDEPPTDAFARLRSTFQGSSMLPKSANKKDNRLRPLGISRSRPNDAPPQTPPFIVHDKDSVRAILISAGSKREVEGDSKKRKRFSGEAKSQGWLDLSEVETQPQLEKVEEWMNKSPLRDAAREEQARSRRGATLYVPPPKTTPRLSLSRESKRKKVRFGDRKNWSFKDEGYMFQR